MDSRRRRDGAATDPRSRRDAAMDQLSRRDAAARPPRRRRASSAAAPRKHHASSGCRRRGEPCRDAAAARARGRRFASFERRQPTARARRAPRCRSSSSTCASSPRFLSNSSRGRSSLRGEPTPRNSHVAAAAPPRLVSSSRSRRRRVSSLRGGLAEISTKNASRRAWCTDGSRRRRGRDVDIPRAGRLREESDRPRTSSKLRRRVQERAGPSYFGPTHIQRGLPLVYQRASIFGRPSHVAPRGGAAIRPNASQRHCGDRPGGDRGSSACTCGRRPDLGRTSTVLARSCSVGMLMSSC
mmetsp:Transcript_32056/g.98992  ORF Transcript_32056/g.98992 Transcript_32056/m.98992 type:complete len:298 (+) Transcript_32056:582-1475(+)